MTASYLPEGHHTVTPYLLLEDIAGFLDFAAKAFDAETVERMAMPDGRIAHAEIRIGDSRIMMGTPDGDEWSVMPAFLHLYVEDMDAAYRRALDAGATSVREPKDELYGDRSAGVRDGFGNLWWIATHVEDVAPEEIERRMREARAQG